MVNYNMTSECLFYNPDDDSYSQREAEKFRRWSALFANVLSGVVRIGSRTPIRNKPIFLTPEVLPGGFASGRFSAGGNLADFERELVAKNHLEVRTSVNERDVWLQNSRKSLNLHFLSAEGLRELYQFLESGKYHCVYPEEAALLVVVWMLKRGDAELARGLVNTIMPYFGDVRFYPRPSSAPISLDLKCSLLSVGAFKREISDMRISKGSFSYAVNKLIVEDFAPNYDGLLSLLLATCNSDLIPFKSRLSNNMVAAFTTLFKNFEQIQRVYNAFFDMAKRAKREMKQLGDSRNCGKLLRITKNLIESKSKRLSRQDKIVAHQILVQIRDDSRRGLPCEWVPGENFENGGLSLDKLPRKLKTFRANQRKTTQAEHQLVSRNWKKLSVDRVSKVSIDDQTGVDDVRSLTQPVSRSEAERYGVKRGSTVPPSISRLATKLERKPIENMFEEGLIPSMEALAMLFDQIMGSVQTRWPGRIEMRQLYASLFGAFRRRRSLLLLNYQSQLRFEELPWVHHLEEVRRKQIGTSSDHNLDIFCDLIRKCISKWPEVMIPNKMVTALDHMARDYGVSTAKGPWIGLLPELAADIFMGGFTSKWYDHATMAKNMMSSLLYGKYYATGAEASPWNEMTRSPHETDPQSKGVQFSTLCAKRAERLKVEGWVARNGAVIEESMILTGQNYPYLLQVLKFYGKNFSSTEVKGISVKCFHRLKKMSKLALDDKNPWQTRLQVTKNVAYGWRQMVALVSIMDQTDIEHFFRQTASLNEAAGGCTLQRALVDLRAAWIASQNESPVRRRPWKPLRGWHSGKHGLWDKSWCEKMKAMVEHS